MGKYVCSYCMKWKHVNIAGFFCACPCIILFLSISTGCANIQPPLGGPKDTLAPSLIKAIPALNTVNFNENKITLQFNEYVKLDNLNENLIINPPAERFPAIEGKLRTVSIKIKDTLQPNTTYTLNFGNAIKDVNEGNPLKNFSYSFSTGAHIDSLELQGKVILAETGQPDSSLIVVLYSNMNDSAVAKEKPRFVTRLNGKGEFHFDHLPAGSFNIFALKDEGLKRYTNNEILLAFFDRPISTYPVDTTILLRAFAGEKPPPKAATAAAKGKEAKIQYSTSLENGEQDLLNPLTISFANKITGFDTAKIKLTDTLYSIMPGYSIIKDTSLKTIKIVQQWKEHMPYKLVLGKGFAHDSAGNSYAKSDTVSFVARGEADYGSIKLKFTGIDNASHPVLQWVENNAIVQSMPLTSGEYRAKLFSPGQYKIRILYDANNNGIWDTGNYWKKIQPEKVIAVDQSISIKANWDNEFDVAL